MYKAIWAAIALTMAVSLGSHGKTTGSEMFDGFVRDTIQDEASTSNANAIAKALGIDPGERNIKYILLTLDTLEAGKIKSAEYQAEENAIDVISENGIINQEAFGSC